MLKKNILLGVGITNETSDNILEYVFKKLHQDLKFYIVTPNPEILVLADKNPKFKKILNNAEIALPDGAGVFIVSIFKAHPFKQRIPGVDFMEHLCEKASKLPVTVGLLGGAEGVAARTSECLRAKYPKLDIIFVGREWSDKGYIKTVKKNIDLLFVAFGAPRQEEWIAKNLYKLPIKAAMAVGGSFDYISKKVHRAPFIVRALGFEWLYRLIRQPWRWRRQLALLTFIRLVFKELFKNRD